MTKKFLFRLISLAGLCASTLLPSIASAQITITDGRSPMITTCTALVPPVPTGAGTYTYTPAGCFTAAAPDTDPRFSIVIEPASITQPASGTGVQSARVYAEANRDIPAGTTYPLIFNLCTAAQGCNASAGGWDFTRFTGAGGAGFSPQNKVTTGSFLVNFQPGLDSSIPPTASNPRRMGLGQLDVPNSPAFSGQRTVAFGLAGPWATAGNVNATITGGVAGGDPGAAIPEIPFGENACEAPGEGVRPGAGPGPCGSYTVPVTQANPAINCSAGMNAGSEIQTAWQFNLAYDNGNIATNRFGMQPRHAIAFRIKTPSVASAPANWFPHTGGLTTQNFTAYGAVPSVYASISEKRCDFDAAAFSAATFNGCHSSGRNGGANVNVKVRQVGDPPADRFECTLRPDTYYYVNLRWEQAREQPGSTACNASESTSGTCAIVMQLN